MKWQLILNKRFDRLLSPQWLSTSLAFIDTQLKTTSRLSQTISPGKTHIQYNEWERLDFYTVLYTRALGTDTIIYLSIIYLCVCVCVVDIARVNESLFYTHRNCESIENESKIGDHLYGTQTLVTNSRDTQRERQSECGAGPLTAYPKHIHTYTMHTITLLFRRQLTKTCLLFKCQNHANSKP
jgi:hypothetical protein